MHSFVDQIALPDFNAGAMENWGLITYRETALLFDPQTSANGNKQRIATVVAHELAHMVLLQSSDKEFFFLFGIMLMVFFCGFQWFGNLVTLKWWNDLWLNEGFASYVEYLGVDYAEPTWNMVRFFYGRYLRYSRYSLPKSYLPPLVSLQKDQIILYDIYRAFAVDSLVSSHPLSCKEEEVNTPAEITQMFNTISYSKVKRFIVFNSINPCVMFSACLVKGFLMGSLVLVGNLFCWGIILYRTQKTVKDKFDNSCPIVPWLLS